MQKIKQQIKKKNLGGILTFFLPQSVIIVYNTTIDDNRRNDKKIKKINKVRENVIVFFFSSNFEVARHQPLATILTLATVTQKKYLCKMTYSTEGDGINC